MHLLHFLCKNSLTWKQPARNIRVYELRYVFTVGCFSRGHLTCVVECLHILYTCYLAVCPLLPQFSHQCHSNLPLKPVPPTPLVHLCERVRWEVATVSSVLTSPSPVMCTHVGPGLPKPFERLPAVGADLAMFRDLSNVLQWAVCPFRGLVICWHWLTLQVRNHIQQSSSE